MARRQPTEKTFGDVAKKVFRDRHARRLNMRLEEQLGLRPRPEKQLPLPLTRTFYGPKVKPDPRANRPRPMRPEDYDRSKTIDVSDPRRGPRFRKFLNKIFDPRRFAPTWKSPINDLFDPFAEVMEFVTPTVTPDGMPLRPILADPSRRWRMTHGLFSCLSGTYPIAPDNIFTSLTNYDSCLTGQAISTPGLANTAVVPNNQSSQGWWRWNKSITNRRYGNYARWIETTSRILDAKTLYLPTPWLAGNPFMAPNPNLVRMAQPVRLADPIPLAEPSPWARSKPIMQFDVSPTGAPMPWAPPAPPHRRAPPRVREKHRKGESPDPSLGPKLADKLEKISEGCDLIDSLYQALPPEVDAKWKCNAIKGGFGGQYEVGGCNCKAAALAHNFHKLDLTDAVRNILTNEIEDRIIGRGAGARDKLRPRKWKNYRPKR